MTAVRARTLIAAAALAAAAVATPASAPAGETFPHVSPESVIETIAGTGERGLSGDGGAATDAQLQQPRDTAIGPDGSIYVADTRNNVIRRIDADGVISTFAGTGVGGFAGDGGPATEAELTWPHDVTVDAEGNVYVADSNNQRIRLIDTDGIITTIAGTGVGGYNGDGGLATEAQLKFPKSVAVHDGALYFADSLNQRIRRVNLRTGVIATVAGTGEKGYGGDGGPALEATFNTPQRIAIDAEGNVFVADTKNNRIRVVDAATGLIRTVVGTGEPGYAGDHGPAVDALVELPRGIALGGDRNLYVADSGSHVIRRVNLGNGTIYTVVGTGESGYAGDGGIAGAANVYGPRGLTVAADGSLIIADTLNNVLRRVTP